MPLPLLLLPQAARSAARAARARDLGCRRIRVISTFVIRNSGVDVCVSRTRDSREGYRRPSHYRNVTGLALPQCALPPCFRPRRSPGSCTRVVAIDRTVRSRILGRALHLVGGPGYERQILDGRWRWVNHDGSLGDSCPRELLAVFSRLVRVIPNAPSVARAGFNPVCFAPESLGLPGRKYSPGASRATTSGRSSSSRGRRASRSPGAPPRPSRARRGGRTRRCPARESSRSVRRRGARSGAIFTSANPRPSPPAAYARAKVR